MRLRGVMWRWRLLSAKTMERTGLPPIPVGLHFPRRASSRVASPIDGPDVFSFLDIPYFEGKGACPFKHRLDIYISGAPFPRPRSRACLFIHGGSWQRGDRRHPDFPDKLYGEVGRALARAGLVGVVMSYRLAPGVQHPEQVRDVARAIRWINRSVSQYGGEPEDIAIVGHSAGAHLAALCLAEKRWLDEEGGLTSTRYHPISAFVGISGIYDVPRMAANTIGRMLACAAFGDDKQAWEAASPLHRVRQSLVEANKMVSMQEVLPNGLILESGGGGGKSVMGDGEEAIKAIVVTTECPLTNIPVLLLTASSDFHLHNDAEGLVSMLKGAQGGVDSSGMVKDVFIGSAEHFVLEGEDHVSVILGFGEAQHQASRMAIDFVLAHPKTSHIPH